MNTLKAFAMGEVNANKELMVFDWIKAAKLIKEHKATHARAGLHLDWEYTGGDILADGKPVSKEDTYVYLASTWAVPELEIDGNGEVISCYKMQSETPAWNSSTYWPQEALDIINAK